MNIMGPNRLGITADRPAGSLGLGASTHRELARAVRLLNGQNVFGANNVLTTVLDPITNRLVLRIVTRDTRELVMQLPAEVVLRLVEQTEPRAR